MKYANILMAAAIGLSGCGGGGGGGGPASLFPAAVTAQDLVAVSYRDDATSESYIVLGDVLGRGQAVVSALAIDPAGYIDDIEWSPDHSLLGVLAQPDGVLDSILYVVEPLTGAVQQVSGPQAAGTYVQDFLWSPDSGHLAFSRNGAPGTPVFTVAADGSGLLEVSGTIVAGGGVASYVWSPDSSKLALAMDADAPLTTEVYVVARDGTGRVKVSGVTTVAGLNAVNVVRWSPDSTRVGYAGVLDAANVFELYVSLATGIGGRTQVHPALPAGGNIGDFQWAPDGSRLAYVADQTTNDVLELYTSLADGTGNVKISGTLVAGGDVDSAFTWAPNSARIAFVADKATDDVRELFTVVPDGSAAAVKVSGSMATGGDIGGFSYSNGEIAWSPDSAFLAYIADQELDGKEEVYVTLPASASPTRVSSSVVPTGAVNGALTWSDDSLRLEYGAQHVTFSNEAYLSPPAGPAAFLEPSDAGDLSGTGSSPFSFAGDRVVLTFSPDAAGVDEIRSYDITTFAEAVVIVPPTPSSVVGIAVR